MSLGAFMAVMSLCAIRARQPVRWLAALAALSTAAYALCSAPEFHLGLYHLPIIFLCSALPATFWCFGNLWFDDEFVLSWQSVLWIPALGLLGLLALNLQGLPPALAGSLGVIRRVLAILLVVHLLWRMRAGAGADLLDERIQARRVVIWVAGLYIVAVVLTELALGSTDPPPWVHALNLTAIWLATALTGVALARWDLRESTEQQSASEPPSSQREASAELPIARERASSRAAAGDARLIGALQHAMESEHLYRQEGLTIATLADHLGTREHQLRRAINQQLGKRNFNEFLHDYRLADVARRLNSVADDHLPILTLALDAGYSSIGPFNRAFRKRFQMTPSEYRQQSAQSA